MAAWTSYPAKNNVHFMKSRLPLTIRTRLVWVGNVDSRKKYLRYKITCLKAELQTLFAPFASLASFALKSFRSQKQAGFLPAQVCDMNIKKAPPKAGLLYIMRLLLS
jgi:hypothetical protein